MAQQIQQDREAISRAVTGFEDAVTGVNTHRTNVARQGESLHGVWRGDAAALYQNFLTGMDQQFDRVGRALSGLHVALQSNVNGFTQTEQEHNDAASRLSSILSGL